MHSYPKELVRYLGRILPDEVSRENDSIVLSSRAQSLIERLATCIRIIAQNPDDLRLPNTNDQRRALVQTLADAGSGEEQRGIRTIAPVCPDYGEGEGFHSQVRLSIGREADAALRGAKVLSEAMRSADIPHSAQIVVADSETDHEEIIVRCAHGDATEYLRRCQVNVELIANELKKEPQDSTSASAFSLLFLPAFHELQHAYERQFSQEVGKDSAIGKEIHRIGKDRITRHAQILGRREQDYELTIRYMAQYAALGQLLAQDGTPTFLMNYQTPNAAFYNYFAREEHHEVIPVFTSIAQRS